MIIIMSLHNLVLGKLLYIATEIVTLNESDCTVLLFLGPAVRGRQRMSLPFAVVVVLLVLLAGSLYAAAEADPYKILGVTRSASQAEIKKVYKRLAKEWYAAVTQIPLLFNMNIHWSVTQAANMVASGWRWMKCFMNKKIFLHLQASRQKQKPRGRGHVHQDHKVL